MLRLLIFTMIVVLSSCTVTKRVHRPGWRVEWHSVRKAPKSNDTAETELGKTEDVKVKNEALNETKIDSSEIDSSSYRQIEKATPENPVKTANFESTEEIDSVSISDDDHLSK